MRQTKTRYSAPVGRCAELEHSHPDRTAHKPLPGIFGDEEFRVWPTRLAMTKAVRKGQQTAMIGQATWRPIVALGETEGYDY